MPTTRRTWKSGTRRSTGKQTKSYGHTTTRSFTATSYSPNKYSNYKKELQAKIGSYRTINQQFAGTGKVTAFSPAGANKWIKYVNQGAWVYKFNTTQFTRLWGQNWNSPSPTAACRFLQKKYGTSIKAVTRGKGNNWLVAAMPRISSHPFSNYNWK